MSECNRTPDQARRDFQSGQLKKASILRSPMARNEWTIYLAGKKGDAGYLLDVATLAPRVFSTVDAAIRALDQIGFATDRISVDS